MAEVEAMVDTSSGFGGAESTYLPSIDGPRESDTPETPGGDDDAGESGEATEQHGESDAATEQPAETAEQPSYSKDPAINELIAKFAKDHPGLDPANAEHLKILNMLAHKEKRIRDLQVKGAQPQDGLTEFERSLLKPAEAPAATAVQRPVAAETRTAQPGAVPYFEGDPGVAWKGPSDAYNELSAAWGKTDAQGNPTPDHQAINRIELAIFQRRAHQSGYLTADQADQMVDRAIQSRLGDVLPHVRESVESRRDLECKEFAITELSKSPEWSGIAELETVDSKEPLIFGEESFPNTPLNRAIAANPEILDINVTHFNGKPLSPIDAKRMTYMTRYKAALRASRNGKIDAGKAKQILEAGAKQREREDGDRTRQGLNGGKGATGLPNGKKTGSLVQEFKDNETRSFSSF